MSKLAKACAAMMVSAIVIPSTAILTSTAVEAKAKPKPKPKPISISQPVNPRNPSNKDKTHTSRKQMVSMAKAAHKRGKATLKTARSDLKAVTKSEARNRQLRLNAKGQMDAAKQAYRANKTPENFQRWQNATYNYLPVRQQHESALAAKRAQTSRVNQLEGFQNQALGSAQAARGLKPRAPRVGTPRFNRAAQFVRPVSAYDVVPGPKSIYGPGPLQRTSTRALNFPPIPQGVVPVGLQAPLGNANLGQNPYTPAPIRQNQYDVVSSSIFE